MNNQLVADALALLQAHAQEGLSANEALGHIVGVSTPSQAQRLLKHLVKAGWAEKRKTTHRGDRGHRYFPRLPAGIQGVRLHTTREYSREEEPVIETGMRVRRLQIEAAKAGVVLSRGDLCFLVMGHELPMLRRALRQAQS